MTKRHTPPRAYLSRFGGVTGNPAPLSDPDQVIFVVALMENDSGKPETLKGIVKGIVGGSVLGSLTLDRTNKVNALIRDVNSAMGTPTGAPNFDDKVGLPQELRFSREELAQAESGESITKTLNFNGDGGRYELTFVARSTDWRRFELAPATGASIHGGITQPLFVRVVETDL